MNTLPFGADEYADRLRRVRDAMAARSLRALIVTDPGNMYYLTGYDAWSFYMPQGLYVPADGDVVLFTREMDAIGAPLICCLPREQILGYPEHLVQHPTLQPMQWVAEELRKRGIGDDPGQPVGIDTESYFFTVRSYQAFTEALPDVRFTDSGSLVNWVRAVKSPAELAMMREAGRITERVMSVAFEAIRPGRRQCDAAAEIMAAQAAGTGDVPGDYPAIVPLLPTGAATCIPHLTWSGAPFESGQATAIEVAGVHRRYHAPIARTVMLGKPDDRLAKTAAIVQDGMDAALAAAKPGNTCEDVHQAWQAVLSAAGMEKPSRIGYSIGIGYPPDWGEGTMSLRPGDTTPLTEGMAFHLMLGLWLDDWGYEISQAFAVGPQAAEPLYTVPRGLHVKNG